MDGGGGGGGGGGMDELPEGAGGGGGGRGGGGGGAAAESPSSGGTWGFPPLCVSLVLATSQGNPENLSSAPMGTNAAMAPAFCTGVDST